jgi:hypothetical protein
MNDSQRRGKGASRLSLRLATRNDVPATVTLLHETFRTPVDEKTWDWYLYGNPLGASRVYLATEAETDNPAGVFAFTPVILRIRGAPIAGSAGHHLCLKPAYQGGSSFVALSRYALASEAEHGVTLALGLPNRKSYRPQKLLLKWADFCWMDCLYKPSPAPGKHDCHRLDRFDAEFDRFYTRLAQGLEFCIDKNAAWMNWRFCDRPGCPYTVCAIKRDGDLVGYVVLKRWREPDGYTKAHIVDLHAVDQAALSHLLAAAESYAAGCRELNLWAASGYPYRSLLETLGFLARDESRQPLIAKLLRETPLAFPRGSASFSYADGDFVY